MNIKNEYLINCPYCKCTSLKSAISGTCPKCGGNISRADIEIIHGTIESSSPYQYNGQYVGQSGTSYMPRSLRILAGG